MFTVDIRSPNPTTMRNTVDYVFRVAESIAYEEGLDVEYKELWNIERVEFDKEIVDSIEEACIELDLKCRRLWSWAGHDAQNMARLSRVGMIFIPSVNGKSHSPDEYSKDEDLVKGLLVLSNTILKLGML